ncbi:MAG: hypothetical protein ACRDZP_06395 [Acidimicrobiales bacterium]
MADIRQDLNRAAQDLTRVGKDAAYIVVGLGVVGLQKAQVRRRELLEQLSQVEGPVGDARTQLAKALSDLDKVFGELIERADATLEPVEQRLPAQAQAVVKQARDARDQLRGYLTSLAA